MPSKLIKPLQLRKEGSGLGPTVVYYFTVCLSGDLYSSHSSPLAMEIGGKGWSMGEGGGLT